MNNSFISGFGSGSELAWPLSNPDLNPVFTNIVTDEGNSLKISRRISRICRKYNIRVRG